MSEKLSEKMDRVAGPASYWIDEVAQLEAEVEQRRKQVEITQETYLELSIEHEQLEAEIERLRESIKSLVTMADRITAKRDTFEWCNAIRNWANDALREQADDKP